jgi:hypothetical protein
MPFVCFSSNFFRGNIYEIVLSLVRLSIILSAKHVSHHLTSYLSITSWTNMLNWIVSSNIMLIAIKQ